MPAWAPPGRTRGHAEGPYDARARGCRECGHDGDHGPRSPRGRKRLPPCEPRQHHWKCGAFLFRQQCEREPEQGDPGTVRQPFAQRGQAQQRGQQDAARPDIVHGLGLNGRHGEDRRRKPRGALRQQAAEAFPREQDGAEMEQQIDEVVAQRIAGADGAVQPEAEIREGPSLPRSPDFQPGARRLEDRVGENGIIVKVKARTERSAEGDQEQQQAGGSAHA